jgi:hypothetical protein
MKIPALVLATLMAASTAFAGENSIFVFATEYEKSRPVAVSILQKADHAAISVAITSEQKEPVEQFREISAARQTLIQEAKKNPRVLVHSGPVLLNNESKSSLKKVASYSPGSEAEVHLLFSLSEYKGDVFSAAKELTKLIKDIKAPGSASYKLSPVRLVVDTPEKYRAKLLQMIFEDLKQVRKSAKKTGKVTISGLENPVLVRQADDTHVELYFHYSVSMELPAE